MTIRIPDGNAFRIRLTARNLITGEYTEAADLSNIDNLVINYVRRGIRFPHAYTIDEEGRATVADAGTLDCGFYGIELTGYYGGEKFRFYGKDLFEITTDTTDVIDPSNLIDIEITVKLNASGVSKDYVDHAINGMETSMETMQADLRDEIAEAGKVDDVKVNGESVVSGKKANITVPTKVSDLTNDSEYQNEQQVQQKVDAAKITSVDISVDGGTGTPSGSAGVSGKQLVIALHNIKGQKGDPGESIVGPQGPKGDSFQPIEDVSGLVLAHTTGQDNTKAMSQKGVTDIVHGTMDEVVVNISNYIYKARINSSSDVIETANDHTLFYIPTKIGDAFHLTATNSDAKVFRYGFTSVVPANGVSMQNVVRLSTTSVNENVVSPINGYFAIHHGNGNFDNMKVTIHKSASANELGERAAKSTLLDLVDTSNYSLKAVALTTTHANSANVYGGLGTRMGSGTTYNAYEYAVQGEKIYVINGRLYGDSGRPEYVFLDSSGKVLSYGAIAGETSASFSKRVIAPRGAVKLYVNGTENAHGLYALTAQKTIYPKMIYEDLSRDSNDREGIFSIRSKFRKAATTVRFIKVRGNISVTLSQNLAIMLVEYDNDFQCLTFNYYNITANTETELSVMPSTSYVKIEAATDFSDNFANAEDIGIPIMKLNGNFPEDWDVFNISQFVEDRQTIIVRVHSTNPICCDDTSNNVQDNGEYFIESGLVSQETWERVGQCLWDYGKIYLPSTYTNTGEATRLIIYCHGAAVNYGIGSIDPDEAIDFEPTYWLKEGYAVMDMEGNPFNNTDEHGYSPQAMECYIAGYKWAIEHYNLKRDGVLLGGRSMGGGMVFNMLRNECPIPVIAGCANVPNAAPTSYWNGATKARREFLAKALGFTESLPTSWSGTSPMPSAEWDCMKANWDKLVKYSLIWPIVTDLPSKDVLMDSSLNISSSSTSPDAENAVYGSLRLKVKAPVKIFGVKLDTLCPWQRTGALYYNMLTNGGQIAEFRVYEGNSELTGTQNHHADTQDPNLRCTVTTKYGEELTNIPVVYVEMLKFWRRFEQE